MINASDLKQEMGPSQGQVYRVLEVESKAAAAKLGGVVKTKLSNVATGRLWEPHFRPGAPERSALEAVSSPGFSTNCPAT